MSQKVRLGGVDYSKLSQYCVFIYNKQDVGL
jgi:hypothetical protein